MRMFELSAAAEAIVAEERLDVADLVKTAKDALRRPGDSYWSDEELWDTHTLMFGTPDFDLTDDYLFEYSNYRSILRDLKELFGDDVEDGSFGHWTYSRFVAVKVRVLDDEGHITGAFAKAYAIGEDLDDYYIYDEQDYMGLEEEVQTRQVREWAEDAGVEPGWVWDAHYDDAIYIEGVGSGFEVFPPTVKNLEPWEERRQRTIDIILKHHKDSEAA